MDASSEVKLEGVKSTEDVAAETTTTETKTTEVPAVDTTTTTTTSEEQKAAPTTETAKLEDKPADVEKPVAQAPEAAIINDLPPPPPNPMAEPVAEPVEAAKPEATTPPAEETPVAQPEVAKTVESQVEATTATPSPVEEPIKPSESVQVTAAPEPAKVEEATAVVPEPIIEPTTVTPVESVPEVPTEVPPPVPTTEVPVIEPVPVAEAVPVEPVAMTEAQDATPTEKVAIIEAVVEEEVKPVEASPVSEAPVEPTIIEIQTPAAAPAPLVVDEQSNVSVSNGVNETDVAKTVQSAGEVPVVKEEAITTPTEPEVTAPNSTLNGSAPEDTKETPSENQKEETSQVIIPETKLETKTITIESPEPILNGDSNTHTNGDIKESPVKSDKQINASALPTSFSWTHGGKEISISGSFNKWTGPVTLAEENGTHGMTLNLAEGEYHYKFLVDGNWTTSNDLPIAEIEEHGQVNIMIVKAPGTEE